MTVTSPGALPLTSTLTPSPQPLPSMTTNGKTLGGRHQMGPTSRSSKYISETTFSGRHSKLHAVIAQTAATPTLACSCWGQLGQLSSGSCKPLRTGRFNRQAGGTYRHGGVSHWWKHFTQPPCAERERTQGDGAQKPTGASAVCSVHLHRRALRDKPGAVCLGGSTPAPRHGAAE